LIGELITLFKKNISTLFLILTLALCFSVQLVSATIYLKDFESNGGESDHNIASVYPAGVTYDNAEGLAFRAPNAFNMSTIAFLLKKEGATTGAFQAAIFDHTGAYGTTMKPSSYVTLALSSTVIMGADILDTNYFYYNFTFSPAFPMVAGEYYCIGVLGLNATINAAALVRFACAATGYYGGNLFYSRASVWYGASACPRFQIYGSGINDVQPTAPTPTPSPIPSGYGQYINGTWIPAENDYITPILETSITTNNIMLAIAVLIILVASILGAKFAGGWGFVAGLTVGVTLDYVFGLVPLWLVVIIGIVDAAALVRGVGGKKDTSEG
jgi:hypothetical protein